MKINALHLCVQPSNVTNHAILLFAATVIVPLKEKSKSFAAFEIVDGDEEKVTPKAMPKHLAVRMCYLDHTKWHQEFTMIWLWEIHCACQSGLRNCHLNVFAGQNGETEAGSTKVNREQERGWEENANCGNNIIHGPCLHKLTPLLAPELQIDWP